MLGGRPLQSRKRSRSRTRSPPREHRGSVPREQEHREAEWLPDFGGQSRGESEPCPALDATQLRSLIYNSSKVAAAGQELGGGAKGQQGGGAAGAGGHAKGVGGDVALDTTRATQLHRILSDKITSGSSLPRLRKHISFHLKKMGVPPLQPARDAIRARVVELAHSCSAGDAAFFTEVLGRWGMPPVPQLELCWELSGVERSARLALPSPVREGKNAAAGQERGGGAKGQQGGGAGGAAGRAKPVGGDVDATKLHKIFSDKITSGSSLPRLRKNISFHAKKLGVPPPPHAGRNPRARGRAGALVLLW